MHALLSIVSLSAMGFSLITSPISSTLSSHRPLALLKALFTPDSSRDMDLSRNAEKSVFQYIYYRKALWGVLWRIYHRSRDMDLSSRSKQSCASASSQGMQPSPPPSLRPSLRREHRADDRIRCMVDSNAVRAGGKTKSGEKFENVRRGFRVWE